MKRILLLLPVLCLAAIVLTSMKSHRDDTNWDGANGNPVELGQVAWGRDLDKAIELAKQKKQDVFLLFQEVPG